MAAGTGSPGNLNVWQRRGGNDSIARRALACRIAPTPESKAAAAPVTAGQAIIFAILIALVVLLVWGRWRYDVVAFASLMAAVGAGLVKPEPAFVVMAVSVPTILLVWPL